jgi:tRNA(Glu) U13 pseudouridine synthase TruD
MFNRLLSDRIAEGNIELEQGEYYCGEHMGFPDIGKSEAEGWIAGKLIGYQTPLNDREHLLLEELGIGKEAFRCKWMPEISSKGTYRTLFSPLKDFNFNDDTFRFALPAGCYATMALREFLDDKP